MKYFVTAIGTDSGKTLVSAILTEALQADYWKPVQAGAPYDSDTVRSLISNNVSRILPERYILNTPASPHAAARIDDVHISLDDFQLPESNNLIVEGAGGMMVPLNDDDLILDLMVRLQIPVILVADLYLGSINHTLLSCDKLESSGLEVKGIIFNGEENRESEQVIEKHSGYEVLFRLRRHENITPELVLKLAQEFRKTNQLL